MRRKVRIGIDVGGTFTDAVILDDKTAEIIAKEKIMTTHHHEDGVARGIIEIINKILVENKILPKDVSFIAHGTTQSTNAMLEGDVAPVGIIAKGKSKLAKRESKIDDIELAPGKFLKVYHEWIDSNEVSNQTIDSAISKLSKQGAEVIISSEAYSIETPENEKKTLERIKSKGIYGAATHEISQLFGLKSRTRTAVINASLIPKMMETADMTENVVKELGIPSELMIMRADGGVMSINEMKKRPILTMLSGLAAGVAGALMYEKVTEGIFLEIGGTSTDISVIKDGKVMIKNAQIGKNKTYLKSLDVRTLGIAGGSMIRIKDGKIIDVGPRSAHLANRPYENFSNLKKIDEVRYIKPLADDTNDYVVVVSDKKEYALTLAGAANVLGYIPKGDYAYTENSSSVLAWESVGKLLNKDAKELAKDAMDIACKKVWNVIEPMIEEYELDKGFVELIGGGGSASVITQALGEKYNLKKRIAKNAPFISTIGVAMAMVREQIERSIINPSIEDIKKIRAEIVSKIMEANVKEETIEVSIQVDKTKNILVATATGATDFKTNSLEVGTLTDEEQKKIVVESVGVKDTGKMKYIGKAGKFTGYIVEKNEKKCLGLINKNTNIGVVIDKDGIVCLRKRNSKLVITNKEKLKKDLMPLIEELSIYSDAGQTIPNMFLFTKSKMYNYSGLTSMDQF
ncbi:MAG: hydantoinase/oxoprolinase family protein, partial [Sarcina sp.]